MTPQPTPPDHSVPCRLLLVVDPQKGFMTPSSAHICERLRSLQQQFDVVIYSRFLNPDPSPFRSILNWHEMGPGSQALDFALDPPKGSDIVEHTDYSSVTPMLLDALARYGAKEVCLAGVATEACVLKTALDLFKANITPWVLCDVCASDKNARFHEMALEVVGAMIGQRHLIERRHLKRQ